MMAGNTFMIRGETKMNKLEELYNTIIKERG